MSRYGQTYDGERRTSGLRVQLTPSEHAAIEAAAENTGASTSEFVRKRCLDGIHAAGRVAAVRRSPEIVRLIYELSAIGNNLNQIARIANTRREPPRPDVLDGTANLLKAAITRVLDL